MDLAVARQTVRFLEVLKPRFFTLENVMGYRHFEGFKLIARALPRLGYFMDWEFLNAADFGVPQTRKRLILRAVLGGLLPGLPAPVEWVGWYEAVEDLLPGLPDSEFAPWQLRRGVQALLDETVLLAQGSFDHSDDGNEREAQEIGKRRADEPAFTVVGTSGEKGTFSRAFLVEGQYHKRDNISVRGEAEPALTVTSMSQPPRAFLVGGQLNQPSGSAQVAEVGRPAFTVCASVQQDWRAFVVDGGNAGKGDRPPTIRFEDEPMWTVDAMYPSKHPKVAFVRLGRVVRMDVRCLARFQSFLDGYVLPAGKMGLAGRVVGNAVPPLLYRRIMESFGF